VISLFVDWPIGQRQGEGGGAIGPFLHFAAQSIPIDKSRREDGTFSRADFRYDATRDIYECPGAKQLRTSGQCTTARRCFIAPASWTATLVRSNGSAARKNRNAKSRATSMNMLATSHDF
jgi:hypothetical protein